jgi:hypothetical protein
MGGRFGKYGDAKRKAKLRQSGFVRKKGEKLKPDLQKKRHLRKKKADSNKSL